MDGVRGALAKEKIQWAEDWYFTVKFALQKLSKDYTDFTQMPGMHLTLAYIYDPIQKLRSFGTWGNMMDINPDGETYAIAQYHNSCWKYVENQKCAIHGSLPLIKPKSIPSNNLFSSTMSLTFGQSSYDPYVVSSNDEEYSVINNITEMMPRRSNRIEYLWPTARLSLNSLSEFPQIWGQLNQNLNDYHPDRMENSRTLWKQDISDCWHQQQKMHSKYTDLSNVALNWLSIIPYCIRMGATACHGRVVISWGQSITAGKTLRKSCIGRLFAYANNRMLAGDDPASVTPNTKNDIEIKRHWMAKVHDFLEMCHGSQNLPTTRRKSHKHKRHMSRIGYIWNTEEIISTSWLNFQHGGVDACKLSEWSPFPPAVSSNQLPGERNQLRNVHPITSIDHHLVDSDDNSKPWSLSATKDWTDCNCDFDNWNDTKTTGRLTLHPRQSKTMALKVWKYQRSGICMLHSMIWDRITDRTTIPMEVRTHPTHSNVWSQLATIQECSCRLEDIHRRMKQRYSDWTAICKMTGGINAGCGVCRHWDVSNISDTVRPLCLSHSAQMEFCVTDVVGQFWKSKKKAMQKLMMVNTMETWRN